MDVQLKELIDKIKNEGVKEAEEAGKKIKDEAESKKSELISNAEKEAAEIIEKARQEAANAEERGNEALKQSGRNLLLQLNTTIQKIFEETVTKEVKEAYSEKILEETIIKLINGWSEKGEAKLEVLLSEEDCGKIESSLKAKLGEKMKEGITIKPVADIEAGFKISEKEGKLYYDFTHKGIAECLMEYLNPKLGELMNKIIEEGV